MNQTSQIVDSSAFISQRNTEPPVTERTSAPTIPDDKRGPVHFDDTMNYSKIFEESKISLKGGAQMSFKVNPQVLMDEHKKYTQGMPA